MPPIVVHQNAADNLSWELAVISLVDLGDGALAPDGLSISYVDHLSDVNFLHIQYSPQLPVFELFPSLVVVVVAHQMLLGTQLVLLLNDVVQSDAANEFGTFDVLSAVRAVMRKEKTFVQALVAEDMSADGEGRADEELETDGAAEFLEVAAREGLGYISTEVWVIRALLIFLLWCSYLELYFKFELPLSSDS